MDSIITTKVDISIRAYSNTHRTCPASTICQLKTGQKISHSRGLPVLKINTDQLGFTPG